MAGFGPYSDIGLHAANSISEQFRSVPRTGSPFPGRLLMHQTACARRSLGGMIGGGTRGREPPCPA